MTNYEYIKSLSAEDMAKYFLVFIPYFLKAENLNYTGVDGLFYPTSDMAVECGVKWLNSECEKWE